MKDCLVIFYDLVCGREACRLEVESAAAQCRPSFFRKYEAACVPIYQVHRPIAGREDMALPGWVGTQHAYAYLNQSSISFFRR